MLTLIGSGQFPLFDNGAGSDVFLADQKININMMEFVTRNSLDGRIDRRTDKRNSNIPYKIVKKQKQKQENGRKCRLKKVFASAIMAGHGPSFELT